MTPTFHPLLTDLAADAGSSTSNVLLSYLMLLAGVALYATASVLFFLDVARTGAAQRASIGAGPGPSSNRRGSLASLPPPSHPLQRAPILLAAGAAVHFAYITNASFVSHVCPIDSVHFMLSITAILASCGYLGARAIFSRGGAAKRTNLDALGLLIAPLGLAFLLGTYFLGRPVADHDAGRAFGPLFLVLHVLVNLVGVSLFVLAGAAATLFLVQEKRLKQKRLAKIGNLPPLDTLDRAVHRFLIAGFPFLTVGIVTGTFWARQLEFGSANEVMRIVFGYATWLAFAAVLLLRAAAGWRGRRSAYGTILGLFCTMAVLAVYLTRPEPTLAPKGSTVRLRSTSAQVAERPCSDSERTP